jgi:hypothetical protein
VNGGECKIRILILNTRKGWIGCEASFMVDENMKRGMYIKGEGLTERPWACFDRGSKQRRFWAWVSWVGTGLAVYIPFDHG